MTKVLDHGYVELVEAWGSEERIIEAARMSTGGGFVSWDAYEGHPKGDTGLLTYLYQHKHATPFEMAGLVLEVKAPIFVFREWHRHRTQSYNELSARYTPLPNEGYRPTTANVQERIATAGANRQARGATDRIPTEDEITAWLDGLDTVYRSTELLYQAGLDLGIPKEIARLAVPVGRYSKMRASANLRNWLAFLNLRLPSTAQWEIRQYAEVVSEIVRLTFPRTHALFTAERP